MEGEGEDRAQGDELSVGEVHEAGDAIDQGQPDRGQGDGRSQLEASDQQGADARVGGYPTATATATATPAPSPTRTPRRRPSSTPTGVPATPAAGYVIDGGVSPAAVARGAPAAITVGVTSGAAGTALIDVEIYDPNGQKAFQTWYDGQSFGAGQRREYSASWTVPGGAPAGTYTLKVGVFSPGWGQLYSWQNQVAQFGVES
jgi:hypothetical protein